MAFQMASTVVLQPNSVAFIAFVVVVVVALVAILVVDAIMHFSAPTELLLH